MRKAAPLVALWLLAATAAVTMAWQGVSVVRDQVTDERPPALAAGEIEQRLEVSTTVTPSRDGALGTSPMTTTAPPPRVETTLRPRETQAAVETRTYNVVGGTAALRFRPTGVEVVFANPAPGFRVEVEPEHGNGVKVEFESDRHESRVDGWWNGGPIDRVREEPSLA